MQYACIRQTKRSKKGINIHRQLFTIHTPSGEIIHIPVFRHPLNGKPVSAVGAEKQSRKHIRLVILCIGASDLSHLMHRFKSLFVYDIPTTIK